MKRKKQLTLKNITILGKFSNGKIRQVVCTEQQQFGVISTLRAMDPKDSINVLDEPIDSISWESNVNLSKK